MPDLVEQFEGLVYWFAGRFAARWRIDAADLAQEGFVAIVRAGARIEAAGRHPGYVGELIKNAMRNEVKRQARHRRAEATDPADLAVLVECAAEADPDRFAELLDLADPRDRDLLARVYAHGELQEAIAAGAGVCRQAVSQRLHGALGRLRDRIHPANDPDA